MKSFYFKNILILYQKEFQRLKHNPSALMAVGLLILMAFLVNIETKAIQKSNRNQAFSPCVITFNEESPLINHLKRNRNPKIPVQFYSLEKLDIPLEKINYAKDTDCAAEISFLASADKTQKPLINITFRTNQKDQTKLHGFSRWLLASMSAFYSDFSIQQSIDGFKNKNHEKPNTGFDLGNAKSKARACKKICVNDILPMTFKGNYHGHKQQVCKRPSAITY